MKYDGIHYEIPLNEIFFLLFKKKTCPNCKTSLKRTTVSELKKGYQINKDHPLSFPGNSNVKAVKHIYFCQQCNKHFTIKELMKRR